jgi:exonuclease SbcD
VKLLHTADWHVGKTIRGRSRADEHRSVLAEITRIAADEDVDVVIVAGDLFDVTAPTAESEQIVYDALLSLANTGASVVVIAGNHDHAQRLAAVRPLLHLTRVTVLSTVARAAEGGVIDVAGKSGERARFALVPFLSQRNIINAETLMTSSAADRVGKYAERYQRITGALCAGFDGACVNVVVAHTTVAGALMGGGEREAHSVQEYHVSASVFPSTAHYVALGHVHRSQAVAAACPAWYAGSPLQLDFGETQNAPCVLVIEAAAGVPARVRQVKLEGGRRLRTLKGTLEQLAARADTASDDYLRLVLTQPARAGLADEARAVFPNAVDVRVADDGTERADGNDDSLESVRGSPAELFREYLAEKNIDDPRVVALFDALLDESPAG